MIYGLKLMSLVCLGMEHEWMVSYKWLHGIGMHDNLRVMAHVFALSLSFYFEYCRTLTLFC